MKRIICLHLVLFLITIHAFADITGKCGDNATWSFDVPSGTMTISGTGALWDVYKLSEPEYESFYQISTIVEHVVINEGITEIGESMFEGDIYPQYPQYSQFPKLTSIVIPSTVQYIGDGAFRYCLNLRKIYAMPKLPPIFLMGYQDTSSPFFYTRVFGLTEEESDFVQNCVLYVPEKPASSFIRYSGAPGWNSIYNIETFNPDDPIDEGKKYADCNGDGVVNSTDIVSIYNYITNGSSPRK